MSVDITALFCCRDDFCKLLNECEQHRLIPSETTRQRAGKLSRAKMLFIVDHGNDTGRNVIQAEEHQLLRLPRPLTNLTQHVHERPQPRWRRPG